MNYHHKSFVPRCPLRAQHVCFGILVCRLTFSTISQLFLTPELKVFLCLASSFSLNLG